MWRQRKPWTQSLPSLHSHRMQLTRPRLPPTKLERTNCKTSGNHECVLCDEFRHCAGSDDPTKTSSFPTIVGRWKVLVLLPLSSSPSASLDLAHVAQSHLPAPCVMTVLRSPGRHQTTSRQWRFLKPSSAVSRVSEDRSGMRRLTSERRGGVTEIHCLPWGRNLATGLSEAM